MAWLSGWTKRIKLTVDNTKIDSALSHFRVVAFLSSTHGDCVFDELAADANRKKIAVTQSDGITQLYCEIEKWDDANESAILHISGSGWSISSSADTDFYLYYLSTQADNTTYIGDIASTPAASVWDTNQKMVQHMVDDTTSTILDSTSNNNDGTKTSANNPLEAIGKVGKGQDFDGGTSDEVAIAAATSINALGDFTFSAAVNFPALGSEYAFVFCDKDTGAKAQFRRHSDKLHCYLFGTPYISTANISAGDHFVAVTRSGTTLSLYSDGALLNSHTVSSTALPSSGYAIGKYDANNTLTLDGIISEAGISNTARNLAWVKATYNSLWDTLLTYGSEEINAAWLSGWTKRIKLTIDNTKVDSALSHFPVTVFLSSTHGDCVFDELTSDANRKKIAVTQSDGTTQLYAEIEKWDDANESAVLHISKTGWSIASGADTDFYLYYLSTQADNTTYIGDIASTPAASVWNSNDKMVQHMVDDTTSTVLDSTSNNNDGTKKAANEPIEAAGKIGQGQDFDGSDDSISVSASTSLNGLGDFTFLAVANLPALGNNKTFLFNDLASTGAFQLWRYQNKCRCAVHGSTFSSTLDVSAGDHLLVATRSGSTLYLYLDDALLNSFAVSTTSMGSNGYLLGKYLTSTTYTLDGVFSEARIANTARPLAWVKATYNSLWDTLLTYGSEEISSAWLPGWTKRIKLTVDNTKIDSALSHLPVTIFLSNTHGDCIFDELTSDANRKKIAVTQSDGTTQMYAEIEKWDDANESAVLHISKTGWSISSSADTDFYLYYLSTQADNTTYIGDPGDVAPQSVWDSSFISVFHLGEDPSCSGFCIKDSTSNAHHGDPQAGLAAANSVTGKVGKCIDFDGTTADRIDLPTSTDFLFGTSDFTVEGILSPDASGGSFFCNYATTNKLHLPYFDSATSARLIVNGGNTVTGIVTTASTFQYFAAVRSGNDLKAYIDNAQSGTTGNVASVSIGESASNFIGASTAHSYNGRIDETRISSTARSDAWRKATYNSLWDTLLTYGSEETSAVLTPVNIDIEELYGDGWLAQDFEELYGNAEWLAQDFEELYGNAEWLAQDFEELWSFPIHRDYEEPYDILLGEFPINYVVEYYRNRATPEISIVEWFGNSATPLFASSIPYGDQIQISKGIEFPYTLLAQPITAIESIYAICDSTLFNDFEEIYTLNLRDPAYSETVQFYSLLSGLAEVHSFAVLVDVDGVSIDPCGISIHGDVNSYCLSLTMEVATIGEYKICSYGKIATVTIGSEDFKFFLEGKSRSREHGKATYIISGMGLTCQLDRPKSATLLRTWDTATTAKAIVEELAVDYIDTVTHPDWWEGVDWAIPANILFANDEPPLDVIRKLVRASGGIVQSYPDGTLRIRKRYPYPVPIWDLTAADFTLSDEDDFFTASESFDFKEGYNKVLISNQDVSDSDRIHIEEVEIDSQTKRLLCYVTIFHEDFELKTSGCPEVTIELIGTVEETIVEVVEIVEGSGTTSKPIYVEDTTKREYLCTQLGSVTFSEDGNLTTEIAGQSLLSITYTTKFREYIVRSPKISQVQFYTETED